MHRKTDTFKWCSEKQSVKTFIDIKFKASLFTPCRRIRGIGSRAPLILSLFARWKCVVKFTFRKFTPGESPVLTR
jgi:hypothetical protein